MFSQAGSPAVQSIVTYRFGASPDATRPDRVMRPATAAILILQRGALFDHPGGGSGRPLPRLALLGPSDQGRIWSTAPDTEFSLVNLAPGASQPLFGVDPRDIAGHMESLRAHALSASLLEQAARGRAALHDYLCAVLRGRATRCQEEPLRARAVLNALQKRLCGYRVKAYADHFGTTSRTLQRIVRTNLGLTPKQVLGIERVRNLVMLTAGGWNRTLADLAQAAGYFDQSHMRHELLRHDFGRVSDHLNGDHIVTDA